MDVAAIQQAKADAKKRYRASPGSDLLGFNIALANRATSPCDILVVADSVGEGVGVNTGTLTNRWINQLVIGLRQAYPVQDVGGGFGYRAAWNNAGVSAPVTSGTVAQATNGLGHRSLTLGAGATITFSELCTSFQLRLKRSTTDALSVSVDGGAAGNITAGPSGEFTYTSAALSRATHSIVVTQTAGTPEVEGLVVFDGDETTGIRLWDSTKGGSKAGDWSTAAGGSQAWLTAATGVTPALLIIALGLNDATTVSAATFKTNVAALVTAARGQWANVPILLVGCYQPPSRQTGLIEAWANYGAQLQALADADSAMAYLDLMHRVGSIATDAYGMLNDTTHPNNKGHRLIAQTVLDYIRPGVRDTDVIKSSAINVDQLYLDTAASVTPAQPAHGGLLYGDSANAAVLAKLALGDLNNQLGRYIALSSSINPMRPAWRFSAVTTAASTITLTLPSAAVVGTRFTIKKVDSGAGTVVVTAPAPGGNQQTIEGTNTKTLSGQWSYVSIISTGISGAGVGWLIEGSGGTVT